MASIWQRISDARTQGISVPARASGPAPIMEMGVHSLIAGNGQHMVLPPRTGGQPWIGHKGRAAPTHPFAPAETFALHAGGVNMPAPTRLRTTVPAVVNSITGQATGGFQLHPGGGVNAPKAQVAPGKVGR